MPQHPIDAYAHDVIARLVPAGKFHRLACVRHVRDRAREATPGFPYRLDYARADRFVRFAANLRHYQGEWAGAFIHLQPHQVFRFGSFFGWVHVDTGLRRFRTAYNEIPRKNGKSLEAAIVALYVTFFDGEPGAEGYCIATKREQAKIVFNDCKKLVQSSGLRSRIAVLMANLHREDTASKLQPLGADADSTDGLNPHLLIVDEFHKHKTRDLIDVMETATGARRQPVNFQITTAGNDPISPCGDQHDYARRILERALVDESFFAFIAHADPEDDWTAEATWAKANPNYGVSVRPDDLRALALKAINMPTAAPTFRQKRLNIWENTIAPWLSLDGWRRGQTTWAAEDMRGQACWIGVDLSSKIDLTAVVFLFAPTEERRTWRVLAICLTPADTLDERARRDRAPYGEWVNLKHLRTNPGNRIDQDVVRAIITDTVEHYDLTVQGIGVDPWNAGNLIDDLQDDGFLVVEVPQNKKQLSDTAKEFEADVLDGRVDGGGNPLLTWCIGNAVAPVDDQGNVLPSKRRSRNHRIDPLMATLNARKLAMGPGDEPADDPDLVVAA
jgi:phage terminase large subunit-like protein